jgi:hypothetical protein
MIRGTATSPLARASAHILSITDILIDTTAIPLGLLMLLNDHEDAGIPEKGITPIP